MDGKRKDIGVVVIGRNEGERLIRCLGSVKREVDQVVYVDSGSADGSPERARSIGVRVLELDKSIPFTAARARNEGLAELIKASPELDKVQFIDGDCELVEGWLERAATVLDSRPEVAVVCGRRRERHPERSIYNRAIDVEWNTPIGEAKACGGDAMMRVQAFLEVGGFDPTLIAGEEPELCLRLRRRGWKVLRIDCDMTWHDAAIYRFGQWWKRALRSGYAYAEGAARYGRDPERYCVREQRRILWWGGVLPCVAIGAAPFTRGISLASFGAYPLSAYRVYRSLRKRGIDHESASAYAILITVGKFAEMAGIFLYWRDRLKQRKRKIS
ncbi:MAG: glycosyltransferase [Deltaproteobacteria bacterium]|nr:glycosyltransferase [Deltaproteobacteria bacterium]